MKQIFTLLFVLVVSSNHGFSQGTTRFNYLTVIVQVKRDILNGVRFLEIVADRDNPNSGLIDSLVKYKSRTAANTGAQFYYERKDSSHLFFNYFRTVSECLEFMDDHNWQLFSILGNTYGTNGNISTEPVYYFRKEKPGL